MNAQTPTPYSDTEPARAEIDALPGATVLEFGADWCAWCQGAQPHIAQALQGQGGLRHLKIADGKGKPLGRSFQVTLWPTLIFLRDGQEMARVVRPAGPQPVSEALARIAPA